MITPLSLVERVVPNALDARPRTGPNNALGLPAVALAKAGTTRATILLLLAVCSASAAPLTTVRLTVDEDPIVPRLAESLGYFKAEGLDVIRVDIMSVAPDDYLMQAPLIKGQIDASYHWFNHAIFGAHHNLPIQAVMVFNDAPGMTVLVANAVKDQIHSAADFAGRRVAEGAGYGTKSVLTHYLVRKAGLAPDSFTPVMLEKEGRQEAVIKGLRAGRVDVMTFEEPITSGIEATGLVSTLYDLNRKETTAQALGAAWPAQSLLMSPAFIEAHPETVQHLVNAFVRTMRYINSHSPDELIAALPADFFGKDRAATIDYVKRTLPSLAQGDYSFSPKSVALVMDTMQGFAFDDSTEGKWRRTAEQPEVNAATLYNNKFVLKAMAMIPAATPAVVGSEGGKVSTGLAMQEARAAGLKAKAKKAYYPANRWDLSDLPAYEPHGQVTGTIRLWGSNYITDGNLGEYWEKAFQKFHPDVKFEYNMLTTRAAVPSLVFGVSDLGMGRKITTEELQLFQRYKNHSPLEITIATGSYNVTGWQPGFGIVVAKDNPLTKITMEQLDGIFGAERLGGWIGTDWHPEFGRGPEKNIRTWGQLGLTGEWADREIIPYGLNQRYHQATEISDRILQGSDKWNEKLRIYANFVATNSKAEDGSGMGFGALSRGLNDDLVKDRYGIAYIAAPVGKALPPELKVLELARTSAGPYYAYTMDNLRSRVYPLVDEIYAYTDPGAGEGLDPKVREYLRFIVSREGQEAVMKDGKYLPLTAEVSQEQLKKLE